LARESVVTHTRESETSTSQAQGPAKGEKLMIYQKMSVGLIAGVTSGG